MKLHGPLYLLSIVTIAPVEAIRPFDLVITFQSKNETELPNPFIKTKAMNLYFKRRFPFQYFKGKGKQK